MFLKFVRAVGGDTGARITGPLSIPLTVLAFYAPTTAQKAAWLCFALLSFVFASYRVWLHEHQRAVIAEATLSGNRPILALEAEYRRTAGSSRPQGFFLTNAGAEAAFDVQLSCIGFGERYILFDQVSVVRSADGKVEVPPRFRDAPTIFEALSLTEMSGMVTSQWSEAEAAQANDRSPVYPPQERHVQLKLVYFDHNRTRYEECSYYVETLFGPAPVDTRIVVRRKP